MTEKIGQGPTRRCDAKCYSAKHPHCDCCCGGRNHGCGLEQAIENTREIFEPLAKAVQAKGGVLVRGEIQTSLFAEARA